MTAPAFEMHITKNWPWALCAEFLFPDVRVDGVVTVEGLAAATWQRLLELKVGSEETAAKEGTVVAQDYRLDEAWHQVPPLLLASALSGQVGELELTHCWA
jgi:hypothetical protein